MRSKILIVDDNENNRIVLADALEDEGYELREAGDGRAALEAVSQEPPDIVLLDIMMPGPDGVECCRRLKADEKTRHIPIILVTALGEEEQVIHGLNAGATDYLSKPFSGPVVRARVRAAMRSKIAHDQLTKRNREIRLLAETIEGKNKRLAEMTATAHRFVDNVAHEFRTPLAVIKEFSSIIADGLGGPVTDEQVEFLEFIENSTRDLARMVDDFLDSSKLKTRTLRLDRRCCRVAEIMERVRPLLATRAGHRKITIVEDLPTGLPDVFADTEKASRVVLNLAINAIKFSPEGGEVHIWAGPTADGGVEIGISDQGRGLSDEDVKTVFERFKQVGNVELAGTKGFGLGLNIARELIWLNLGSVNVISEPGAGSTFSFTLPPDRPDAILRRYLDRLEELDEGPDRLVVLRASVTDPAAGGEALRSRLVAVCHPMDIALTVNRNGTVVLVGSTAEPDRWMERLQEAVSSTDGPSPAVAGLNLRCLGCWPFGDADAITDGVLGLFRETRAGV
jgi:signal transduction histidine kinase